jgi:hypothetical protein
MSRTLTIDPRDFIMGPFLTCPKCGAPEYGVLSVGDGRCQRRCRTCWFTGSVRLPELTKKVVYIDQFAVSNIMKVLSPEARGHERTASEPLWSELFETLSVVTGLQLVVCPDSREHEHESLASPFHRSLKRTYEHLSGGITFEDFESIRLGQATQIAKCWVRKEPLQFDFDPRKVTHGNPHGWGDRILISVDGVLPGTVERLRTARSQGHSGLQSVFKRWQRERPSFTEVFAIEKRAYQETLLSEYRKCRERRARMPLLMMRGEMPSLDEIMPSASECMISALQRLFESELGSDRISDRMLEFFRSGALNEAPSNVIMSAMFASLAVKAVSGQREVPNQGTLTDISVVSTLLPYCDAMFVDNKCRALLSDIPGAHKLPYSCAVFSPNIGRDFIRYLQEIRDSAPQEHLRLIEEIYRRDPLEPHAGIYGIGKFRRAAEA